MEVAKQRYRLFTRDDIDRIPQLMSLPEDQRKAMKAISAVLPFRVNNYVIDKLIDWSAVPDDPVFKMVFPQVGMVSPEGEARIMGLLDRGAGDEEIEGAAREIRGRLNARPGGQRSLNTAFLDGRPVPGLQHKYPETVLFFPAAGQCCHTYCTYCFRWAQFTTSVEDRFESHETRSLVRYLRAHPEVTNVLITGGDPLVMRADVLRRYVEPLLDPSLAHVTSVRIGTKSLSYWPHRFLSDDDAEEILELFRDIRRSGRLLAVMAHLSHPRELSTTAARAALRRIRGTGAVVRSQSPLVRGVNDNAAVWTDFWRRQIQLGVVPYYLFVARDTGAQEYFKVPLVRALEIYQEAYRHVSGLARTVRGPVMSATPGKVVVEGVSRVAGEDVLVLKFIQGRDPSWVGRPFFAAMDPDASWLGELRPAFGEAEFFFEKPMREIVEARGRAPDRARERRWMARGASTDH